MGWDSPHVPGKESPREPGDRIDTKLRCREEGGEVPRSMPAVHTAATSECGESEIRRHS